MAHIRLQISEKRWLQPTLKVLGAGAVAARKLGSPRLGRAVLAGAQLAVEHGFEQTVVGIEEDKPEPPRSGAGLVCGGGPKAG